MLNHFEAIIWGPKLHQPFLSALHNKGVEKFHQGEVFFEQVAYNFLHVFYAALAGIVFVYLYKIFQKNDNYEEFLTKFVNTN